MSLDLAGSEPRAIAEAIARCGAGVVVNCAGRTSGNHSELHAANVEVVVRLVGALQLMDRPPRLVHLGSAAEYGPKPAGVPVGEDAPAEPVSAYGTSKLAASRLIAVASRRHAIEGLVLRVFNAVGPGMPRGTLAGSALAQLRQAEALGLAQLGMGPLSAVRDFVDVRDIGGAVVAACGAPWDDVQIVNVGTGQPHSARELVEALARRLDFRGRISETAPGSERSGDVPWMVADVSLAERLLGWRAEHDLDSMAAALVEAKE